MVGNVQKKKLEEKHRDYFVFGHRHLPLEIQLNETSKYINLGDWITLLHLWCF